MEKERIRREELLRVAHGGSGWLKWEKDGSVRLFVSRGRRRLGVEAVVMKGKYRGTEDEADAGSNKVRGRRGGGGRGEAEAGCKGMSKGMAGVEGKGVVPYRRDRE